MRMKVGIMAVLVVAFGTGCDGSESPADSVLDIGVDRVDASDGVGDQPEAIEKGECLTSADCGGLACVRVPDRPGGYRLCLKPLPDEAVQCSDTGMDDCCSSSECTGGEEGGCYFFGDVECAGGEQLAQHNQCFYTRCRSDEDCPGDALCVPAGALGLPRNACVTEVHCQDSLDCSEKPGAYCRPFMDACCHAKPDGFFCVDPMTCEEDEDCSSDMESCQGYSTTGWALCVMQIC